jgi:hypothetical protein
MDATGMPLFSDPNSRVLERISLDKTKPNVLVDEITTIDTALTKPWTVTKKYGRDPKEAVEWSEENCAEGNGHIEIQGQGYFSCRGRRPDVFQEGPAAPAFLQAA